jgi:hypothetical protein
LVVEDFHQGISHGFAHRLTLLFSSRKGRVLRRDVLADCHAGNRCGSDTELLCNQL